MHFNIQINIQKVTEPEQLKDTNGYPVKVAGREVLKERQVVEVLKLAVTADTEQDAYAKAHRMLAANEPISEASPDPRFVYDWQKEEQ